MINKPNKEMLAPKGMVSAKVESLGLEVNLDAPIWDGRSEDVEFSLESWDAWSEPCGVDYLCYVGREDSIEDTKEFVEHYVEFLGGEEALDTPLDVKELESLENFDAIKAWCEEKDVTIYVLKKHPLLEKTKELFSSFERHKMSLNTNEMFKVGKDGGWCFNVSREEMWGDCLLVVSLLDEMDWIKENIKSVSNLREMVLKAIANRDYGMLCNVKDLEYYCRLVLYVLSCVLEKEDWEERFSKPSCDWDNIREDSLYLSNYALNVCDGLRDFVDLPPWKCELGVEERGVTLKEGTLESTIVSKPLNAKEWKEKMLEKMEDKDKWALECVNVEALMNLSKEELDYYSKAMDVK